MSSLLISEPPMQVLPSLAVAIGLNQAIVLQQLHYWILRAGKERDGHKWVFATYPELAQQFPFWSISTIKRTMRDLVDNGYVLVGNFNRMNIDRTNWYAVCYERVNMTPWSGQFEPLSSGQSDPTNNQRVRYNPPPIRACARETSNDSLTPPPASMAVTDDLRARCHLAGCPEPTDDHIALFLAKARDAGKLSADWGEALMAWMLKEKKFAAIDRQRRQHNGASNAGSGKGGNTAFARGVAGAFTDDP